MPALAQSLEQYIKKPLGPYRDEESLNIVLKKRFTKKEYKLFFARLKGEEGAQLLEHLKLDEKRYAELWKNIEKKLNLDTIKHELFDL